MAYQNQAAWLDGQGQQLRIGPAAFPQAGEGEVVIQNKAIALNPISCKMQDFGIAIRDLPTVLDYDVAGEIVEVGAGVEHVRKGDRVVAWCEGPFGRDPKYGAFQLYSIAKATTVARLPDKIPFSEGCVLGVAINTAIVALSGPLGTGPGKGFGLTIPALDDEARPSEGKTMVIWGASSSVGLITLQLARLAGIQAVAVASAHNLDLCRSSGAIEALDYHEQSIVEDAVRAIEATGGEFVGVLDCVSVPEQSLKLCIPVIEKLGGGLLGFLQPHLQPEVPDCVKRVTILGVGDVTHPFWRSYITPALESGKLKCLPEPLTVGEGLESLQKALDVLKRGVSAKKVVVTL